MSGGCSVSSDCLVAAARGTQRAQMKLDVKVWMMMSGWKELKTLEMMGPWRMMTSDYGMTYPFAVAAS